jgi:hypothetical protein
VGVYVNPPAELAGLLHDMADKVEQSDDARMEDMRISQCEGRYVVELKYSFVERK